jgi:hypothetical protein
MLYSISNFVELSFFLENCLKTYLPVIVATHVSQLAQSFSSLIQS